jgi:hypothetical protein
MISRPSLAPILAIALSTFGCGGGNGGLTRYGALEFSLRIDKQAYSIGESVHVVFTVHNVGTTSVTGITYSDFTVTRLFRNGALLYDQTTVTTDPDTPMFGIAAGETVTAEFDLPTAIGSLPSPLQNGQYTFYMGFWAKRVTGEAQDHPVFDPSLYAKPVSFTIQ